MECHVCSEVVHPSCMERNKKTSAKKLLAKCKISKKVNNSWECPKCCLSDDDVSAPSFYLFLNIWQMLYHNGKIKRA